MVFLPFLLVQLFTCTRSYDFAISAYTPPARTYLQTNYFSWTVTRNEWPGMKYLERYEAPPRINTHCMQDDFRCLANEAAVEVPHISNKLVTFLYIEGTSQLDMTRNLMIYLNGVGIKPLIGTSTPELVEPLTEMGAKIYFNHESSDITIFFQKLTMFRLQLLGSLLDMGFCVLSMDNDIVVLEDPLKHLICDGCDFLMQVDSPLLVTELNTGFALYHPTNIMRAMFRVWIRNYRRLGADMTEQRLFHHILQRALKDKTAINYVVLPFDLFKTAYEMQFGIFDVFNMDLSRENSVIFHFNWVAGIGKEYRMREVGLWLIDDVYSLDKMYLKYDNIYENPYWVENKILEKAFTLAGLLDRILILPTFSCTHAKPYNHHKYEPTYDSWFGYMPPTVSKNPYAKCSYELATDVSKKADMEEYIELVKEFHKKYRDKFREHNFFQHPSVPPEILNSTQCFILKSEYTSHKPDCIVIENESLQLNDLSDMLKPHKNVKVMDFVELNKLNDYF